VSTSKNQSDLDCKLGCLVVVSWFLIIENYYIRLSMSRQFYPESKEELEAMIKTMVDNAAKRMLLEWTPQPGTRTRDRSPVLSSR
jgi:hypothetical protein